MARFVFVHGAFTGAWIWEPLVEQLRAAGHTATAFDLPGSGADQTAVAAVTLEAYASRLCDELSKHPEPAIVVGNSMGGIVATQGAVRCPERVKALVYVAAFIPQDGQSLLDLTHLPEGAGDQVQANVVISGEPPVATMPVTASGAALYGSCADDVVERTVARQRPQPVAPFATPASVPARALDGIPKFYVLCSRDRAIPAALQRRMSRDAGCAEVVELDTDHTPQLSKTRELADALNAFATRVHVPT